MTDEKNEKKSRSTRPRRRRATAPSPSSAKAPAQPAPPRVLATIPLHVRWRDLDAFNHVNNAAYLTYLEEARLQWLRQVPGDWFGEHAMPVTASVEMHYRKPINWPAEIDVQLTCVRLGNSSITVGHRIVERGDATSVHADGQVVLVWIDPATGASVSLPDTIRSVCSG